MEFYEISIVSFPCIFLGMIPGTYILSVHAYTKPVNIAFQNTLTGYSSSGYPVMSTALQNKMDVYLSITFQAEFWPDNFFVTGSSLTCYILKQFIHLSVSE